MSQQMDFLWCPSIQKPLAALKHRIALASPLPHAPIRANIFSFTILSFSAGFYTPILAVRAGCWFSIPARAR
jgi:hypothetical protein